MGYDDPSVAEEIATSIDDSIPSSEPVILSKRKRETLREELVSKLIKIDAEESVKSKKLSDDLDVLKSRLDLNDSKVEKILSILDQIKDKLA